jgi:ubiquinone/menaquinone biosynthesis C-methylase UbiE
VFAVDFVRADAVDLSCLADATFDLVYTGGCVAAWVCNLQRYCGEAARILKPDGLLIVCEYHRFRRVFRRPWSHSASSLEIAFNYFDRGPHRFEAAPDVLYLQPGELEQFELHRTAAAYIAALLSSGCRFVHAEEFGDTCGE